MIMFKMAAKNREKTKVITTSGLNPYGMISSISKGFDKGLLHGKTDLDPLWNPKDEALEENVSSVKIEPRIEVPRLSVNEPIPVLMSPVIAEPDENSLVVVDTVEKKQSVFDFKVGLKLINEQKELTAVEHRRQQEIGMVDDKPKRKEPPSRINTNVKHTNDVSGTLNSSDPLQTSNSTDPQTTS